MLIRQEFLRGIKSGAVTLAFRKWRSPTVKSGGTLKTAIGLLAIDEVALVRQKDITEADAGAAGYGSRKQLLAELALRAEGKLYRIRLRLAGPDPRKKLSRATKVTPIELQALRAKLARMDARSSEGAWTSAALRAIAARPNCRAADLARDLGFGKERLKTNVRKLKNLGLTQSLETGYRLSPRGQALLAELTA
jgi:hypothetical protein